MINQKQVLKEIELNKHRLKENGVTKIGIFGSILHKRFNKKSDIDVLIKFKKVSFDNYSEVLILLEKILKRKIDLITESSLRPELNYVKNETKYARI